MSTRSKAPKFVMVDGELTEVPTEEEKRRLLDEIGHAPTCPYPKDHCDCRTYEATPALRAEVAALYASEAPMPVADENHAKKIAWVNEWFRSDHRRSNGCTATTGERILTAQQIVGLLDAWETARLRLDYGRCQYCKAEVPSHCNTCASCADERGP